MAASAPNAAGASGRNPIRRALVVGTERLTRLTNWADRNTCVLFGDGAGAAVLEWDESRSGILGSFIVNADDETNALSCPLSYDVVPPFDSRGVSTEASRQEDPSTSRVDAEAMTEAVRQVLSRTGLTLDDIACIVPHQANERIIKYAAKKLDLPLDFFQMSIAQTGNTSAASVPMALADAYAEGRIKRGDKVILTAFGGGFTSGALVFEA